MKNIMPRNAAGILLLGVSLLGCGSKDDQRIQTLHRLPVLYESEVLTAVTKNPAPDALFPMDDSYDPNLAQAIQGDYHTENYVPASVLALTKKGAEFDTRKPKRLPTIKIGDRVSVLATADSGNKRIVYLVRTVHQTYCWLYPFHLQDRNGKRLEEMGPM